MTDKDNVAGILRDISLLYELSLSAGQSLELSENCDRFLRTLMARKSLDFASVWIRDRVTADEEDVIGDGLTQVYANPSFRAPRQTLPASHPLVARIDQDPCFSVSHGDPGFDAIVTETGIDRGTFAVYRLGTLGFLKLYSIARHAPFPRVELSKLRHVVEKFTVSLEGCLDHARVRIAQQRRRELELQMVHAQKLESLGLMAGGVAHDFNNLLTVILGNAELVRPMLAQDGREHVDDIVGATIRAADLCSQLLAYSGRGPLVSAPLSLNEIVQEMLRLTAVTVSKKAEVVRDLTDEVLTIEGDAAQIRQVVMNLVTNASEALGEASGTLRVATGRVRMEQADLAEYTLGEAREEGEYAFIDVQDTGCGIDSGARQKLFDPFFTTKFTGRGLGLAAVLGIVRAHRGAIRVRSGIDLGTDVRVLLPLLASRAPQNQEGPRTAPTSTGRVLIADDEREVRVLLGRLVGALGYEVIFACDGGEALETYTEYRHELDLIILDLTMPVMSGNEVFERIAREGSGTPVILTSGYSEEEIHTRLHDLRPAAFLPKPFRTAEVGEVVERVLRRRRAEARGSGAERDPRSRDRSGGAYARE